MSDVRLVRSMLDLSSRPGKLSLQAVVQTISGLAFERIPERVRQRAALSILDGLGVAIAGASHPIIARVEHAVKALGSLGASTVPGRPPRSILDAVLINGTAMQVHDLDEAHLPSRTHPSVAILPAVLAVAEQRRLPGRDVILAYLTGYEVETAIGCSLLPEHYARGWHATATLGAFGAAAAVAKLLRLDTEAAGHAINLAGAQAAGVRATFGSMVKHMNPGKAAVNGVLAAVWAQAGITSGADTFAHAHGFAAASTGRVASLAESYDDRWAIEQSTAKRYPCCLESHPSIELALRLRAAGLATADIGSLTLRLHPDVVKLVGGAEPESGIAAKFSLPHCVALALVQGTVAIADFARDPEAGTVADLRRRIHLIADDKLAYTACVGEAVDRDGRIRHERMDYARGSPAEPFTPTEMREKFLELARPVLGSRRAEELMHLTLQLDSLPDVSQLMRAAT